MLCMLAGGEGGGGGYGNPGPKGNAAQMIKAGRGMQTQGLNAQGCISRRKRSNFSIASRRFYIKVPTKVPEFAISF